MKTTHTEFERYYQQVRSRQKRDAVCWSLLLLALYFAAGSAAEFNLLTIWHSLPHFFDYMAETIPPLSAGNLFADVQTKGSLLLLALYFAAGSAAEFNLLTIWHSLPHFFDYMAETIPPLSAGNLFADVQTKGSLAWWGYRLPIQLPLIWETLQLALASTLVAVAIATVFAFLAANNAWSPAPVRFAIRVLVAFLRTMPELAWAVIFVMAFGIGAIPGFLALMLHTVGSLTKLFYEAVESAQNKPVRGLAACGASPLQKIRFALWPQVKPLFLSYGFMRLEINFRSSTILGLVGAGGIGQELMTNIKLDRYDQVSITLLLIILVVSALDMLSGRLRLWVLEGKK
ncbi:phosphonate ABC transporter, permease protein PhnE [Klebsiella pneumoniae]|uniref:phosphonate ABC transporter, permease protein PhnE n=1 Tax=Klebsiella pneumoniae TaxID=573 RepID=UPI003905EC8D